MVVTNRTFLNPADQIKAFSGYPTEDAEQWIRKIETIARTQNTAVTDILQYGVSKFKNTAKFWHRATGEDLAEDWEQYKSAFIKRFKRPFNHEIWVEKLKQIKQKPGEAITEYIQRRLQLVNENKYIVDFAEKRNHLLQNFKNESERSALLAHCCLTFDELINRADALDLGNPAVKEHLLKLARGKDSEQEDKSSSEHRDREKKFTKKKDFKSSKFQSSDKKPFQKPSRFEDSKKKFRSDDKKGRVDFKKPQFKKFEKKDPSKFVHRFKTAKPKTLWPLDNEAYRNDTGCRFCHAKDHTVITCNKLKDASKLSKVDLNMIQLSEITEYDNLNYDSDPFYRSDTDSDSPEQSEYESEPNHSDSDDSSSD
jgi:hypothetical protein